MVDKLINKNVKIITTAQACRIYQKNRSTIKRWCEGGKLRATKDPGGGWSIIVIQDDYDTLLKSSLRLKKS